MILASKYLQQMNLIQFIPLIDLFDLIYKWRKSLKKYGFLSENLHILGKIANYHTPKSIRMKIV